MCLVFQIAGCTFTRVLMTVTMRVFINEETCILLLSTKCFQCKPLVLLIAVKCECFGDKLNLCLQVFICFQKISLSHSSSVFLSDDGGLPSFVLLLLFFIFYLCLVGKWQG